MVAHVPLLSCNVPSRETALPNYQRPLYCGKETKTAVNIVFCLSQACRFHALWLLVRSGEFRLRAERVTCPCSLVCWAYRCEGIRIRNNFILPKGFTNSMKTHVRHSMRLGSLLLLAVLGFAQSGPSLNGSYAFLASARQYDSFGETGGAIL